MLDVWRSPSTKSKETGDLPVKRLIVISAAVLAIVTITAVCRADGFHEGFSNKSLHGVYVVKFQGTNSGGDGTLEGESLAPVNGVGLINADGDGHFTGMQTANILFNTSGSPTAASPGPCPGPFGVCTAICTTTLKGTYTVNPDGTGSITATAIPSGTDLRCGPKSGFTTSSDIILKSPRHLVFVGTDFDSTVGGEATRQEREKEFHDRGDSSR